jgi:hypothetical protein
MNKIIFIPYLLLSFIGFAQPETIDNSFNNPTHTGINTGDGANSSVLTTAIQNDGKIIIPYFNWEKHRTPFTFLLSRPKITLHSILTKEQKKTTSLRRWF